MSHAATNHIRYAWLTRAMRERHLDALICALPSNVLLLSGYWPVVGTALAIVSADGDVVIIAPSDEEALTSTRWTGSVMTFDAASLDELRSVAEAVRRPLSAAAERLGMGAARIGYEAGPVTEPASYAAMHLYGAGIAALLHAAIPGATLAAADDLLAQLRGTLSPDEIARLRLTCGIAGRAFLGGSRRIRAGLTETEAAVLVRDPLSCDGTGSDDVERADGFVFCMSGPHSADAFGAYARSRARRLSAGDLALVHCNSYADGYWTDITRTYCLGPPDVRQRRMYGAVFAAREAALAIIRPGVRAADVDAAARGVLEAHGFGREFKHATGHGVGFAAIDHNARPRLHPKSDDLLETGMVFNVEPAIYIEGYGGIRHCDMVVVTSDGMEVLTPFQTTPDTLVL